MSRPRLSLQIQLAPEAGELPVDRARIRRWAAASLSRDATLVLRLVGQAEGRMLNGRFRQRDKPTNVLTFDYETEPQVVADIVVCMPVVRAEARAQRKPVADHLAHLIVHGVLHAQGHDHQDETQAEAMETLESRILARFRIADPYRGSAGSGKPAPGDSAGPAARASPAGAPRRRPAGR